MPFPLRSPTLFALCLALATGSSLAAATAQERDTHFAAVQAVIERDLRLSAVRLQAEFVAASYPEDTWHRKALAWFAADRFRNAVTEAKAAAEFDKQANTLRAEIDAAEKAGTLPAVVAALMNGAGDGALRAVNDIGRILPFDGVAPLVPPAPEKIAATKRQIDYLVDNTPKKFAALVAKVKAHAEAEKDIWDFPDGDPKGTKLIQEATFLRADAVKALYIPHLALREVITRGKEFGFDGTGAGKMFATVLKEHAATISDWDYNFGDYYPPLKAQANMVLAEALRQGVGGIKIADVEKELLVITDKDAKTFSAATRTHMVELQLSCWSSLLRTRLELGGPANIKAGLKHFQDFLDRYKSDPAVKVGANNDYTREIGAVYILAARLHAANNDTSKANALLGQVTANRKSPQVDNARGWMRQLTGEGGSGSGGGDWGAPVTPQDPSQALSVGKALMSEARDTANASLARSQLLAAAVGMRAGVAGLASGWQDQLIEVGPELFNVYATCLSRLEMRGHAAIVAAEGLRLIKATIDANPKQNPWRSGPKKEFTEAGKKVGALATNALTHGNNLAARMKGTGVQSLNGDIIDLAKAVAPEVTGKSTEWQQVVIKLVEKDWDGAIKSATTYRASYPEDTVKVFGAITSAHMGRYDDAKERKDTAGMKSAADAMSAFGAEIQAYIDQAKAKGGLTADQERDLMRAAGTIKSSKIAILIGNEQYAEVLAQLDASFWKNPPSDESLMARLLRAMVTAAQKSERARIKDPAAALDAKALVAAWPTYKATYETFERMLPRIKDPDEKAKTQRSGRTLGDLFQVTGALADQLKDKADAPAELTEIAAFSKRALADAVEPVITESEKPETMLAIAFTLWEIDEHERSARLLEMYTKKVGENPTFKTFKDDPKGALDPVEALVGGRPELHGKNSDWTKVTLWAKARDLIEDKPGLADLRAKGVARDQWGEFPRDLGQALVELRKVTDKVNENKTKLGDQATKAVEAIKALQDLVRGTLQEQEVWKRLAMSHREAGRTDQARSIFLKLYVEDPDDPAVATNVVDITVDQVKKGDSVAKADIEKALAIAKGIRNDNENDPVLYWTSSIQVYELTAALGGKEDLAYINSGLKFAAVNQSDPSYTLVQPRIVADARQIGDDRSVRRAANALAVELCRRYLKVFELPGVTQKAPYRIDEITVDGKPKTIFVPVDAGTFEARPAIAEDDSELIIIVPQGTAEVQKPAAAAPAPAAVAPAPATTPSAPAQEATP